MTVFKKGLAPTTEKLDGSDLRILIVHTRWNVEIVQALVEKTEKTLLSKFGVQKSNICVESVPGAFELPYAAQQLVHLSRQVPNGGSDLLSFGASSGSPTGSQKENSRPSSQVGASLTKNATKAFDAVICIGVLIKGSTMHFEVRDVAFSASVCLLHLTHTLNYTLNTYSTLQKPSLMES